MRRCGANWAGARRTPCRKACAPRPRGTAAARIPTMMLAEQAALVGLAFFLPLYEAPKNILWLAFVVLWLVNRVRTRDFGGPWDRWDTLIAVWIVSGFASAAFAGLPGDVWRA